MIKILFGINTVLNGLRYIYFSCNLFNFTRVVTARGNRIFDILPDEKTQDILLRHIYKLSKIQGFFKC